MPLRVRRNRAPTPPESCPLTECMALLGGAWTPNVIWYLSAGARRFSELKGDISPITARVLTKRLRELERHGVVMRRAAPTSPPSVEYELTDLGGELLPAIQAIVRVGERLKQIAAAPSRRGALGGGDRPGPLMRRRPIACPVDLEPAREHRRFSRAGHPWRSADDVQSRRSKGCRGAWTRPFRRVPPGQPVDKNPGFQRSGKFRHVIDI
jgi:DNA-binding HxlR family transcriptional regulator